MSEEKKKIDPAKRAKALKTVREYVVSFLLAILIALTVRHFVVEPFKIPSGSMIPTLLVGDFIFVNKFKYGFQVPFVEKRFVKFSDPKRGDVVVFVYPRTKQDLLAHESKKDYIKRVVGIAGDEIDFKDRTIYVNGKPIKKMEQGDYTYKQKDTAEPISGDLYVEDVGGKKHYALYIDNMRGNQNFNYIPMTVPKGYFFVMGDNRNNSSDSRDWGLVPLDNLKGKALIVWLSIDGNFDKLYNWIRWDRLFKVIR